MDKINNQIATYIKRDARSAIIERINSMSACQEFYDSSTVDEIYLDGAVLCLEFSVNWETCNHVAWDDEEDWEYTGGYSGFNLLGVKAEDEDGNPVTISQEVYDAIESFNN